MVIRYVIEIKYKTVFGNAEFLVTNIKKAYLSYYKPHCLAIGGTCISYSAVAAGLSRNGRFLDVGNKIAIIKRMVF